MILSRLRAVLMLRYAPSMEREFAAEFTPDDVEFLRSLALSKEKHINSHVLMEFLDASKLIGFSTIRSLPIELALIRIVGEAK